MALQVIEPPLTDNSLRDLRRRTAARLMQARVEMRAGWLLHPDNAVRRADWVSPYASLAETIAAGINGFVSSVQAVAAATAQAARSLNAMAAQAPTYALDKAEFERLAPANVTLASIIGTAPNIEKCWGCNGAGEYLEGEAMVTCVVCDGEKTLGGGAA